MTVIEALVQRIKGWSVLRESSEQTIFHTLRILFIMPDGCPGYPEDGAYYISTSNLCVGNQQVGDVDNIVVNDQKTVGLSTLPTELGMKWDVSPGFLLEMAPCGSLHLRD